MTRLLSNEQFFSCLRVRELSISHGRSYSISSGNPVSDFQNLEILNLIGCETWSFFHGLEPSDGPVPCSLLKEIRVIAYHDRQFEWWQFMRMAEAGWRAGYGLEKPVVLDGRNGTPEVLPPQVYPAVKRFVRVVQAGNTQPAMLSSCTKLLNMNITTRMRSTLLSTLILLPI